MSGSIHKINRNNHYILKLSGSSVLTATISDNGFINNCIPYYKESSKWFKSYLPLNSQFIDYVLYTATYSGSPLQIQQQEESNSISTSDYRKSTSSFYDNRIYKDYNILRLNEKKEQLDNRKENRIYYKTEPNIFNNRSVEEKIYNSERESPIEFSNESIKYNLDGLIDGFSTVTDLNFSNEVLNNYYNNQNYVKKYNSLESVFGFDGKLFLSHKQTVYPNQNYIWNRNRPTYTYSAWIDNQDLRERPGEYVYEYSGEDSLSSGSFIYEFNPSIGGDVRKILLDNDKLYIGGSFTRFNGYSVGYMTKVNNSNLTFDEVFNPNANASVSDFCISGSNLYVAGGFTTVSAESRDRFASIEKDNGLLNPINIQSNGYISTLLLDGNNLYIAGSFTSILGQTRNRVASINTISNTLLPFNPNVGTLDNYVFCMLMSGSNLYIGGLFTQVSGTTRNRICAVDKNSGALLPFNPSITSVDSSVNSLLLSGSNLYLGGTFTTISGSTRNNIACVNKDSGALLAFNPNVNSQVNSLLLSGTVLYLGGDFTQISGTTRNYIGAVNKDSGALNVSFNPSSNGVIYDLEISGSNLYVGGSFSEIYSVTRNNFAIINKDTFTMYSSGLTFTSSNPTSIWPLDGWIRYGIFDSYVYGEYITGSLNDEYQVDDFIKSNQTWNKPFRFTFNDLPCSFWNNGEIYKSIWTVPEETNSFPFFNSDDDFLKNIKSKYKDYTNIPEYNISNFIIDYSLNTGSYDIYENGIELNNQTIFRTNGNESKNSFNIKKEIDKEVVKIKFNLNCVNLFRPYRNLYPVEKILQISKILYKKILEGNISGTIDPEISKITIDEQIYAKNFLLEPFVSPGILWNSIKTGFPYIWPYATGVVDIYGSFASASNSFPFESIYNPLKYLNQFQGMSSRDDFNTLKDISFSGSYFDPKYTDCIENFIKDSSDFFLNTEENFVYFQSKPENDFSLFLSGNHYDMIISLDNNFETSSYNFQSSISAAPITLGIYQTSQYDDSYYSLFIPPYFKYYTEYGTLSSAPTYNSLRISFRPDQTKNYTLSEIISSSLIQRQLTDGRWSDKDLIENIKEYGQNILKSYNIFEFEKFGENDRRWNISGKWEVPVFDYSEVISKFTEVESSYLWSVIGYGHQFGKKRHGRSNLTLNISDVSGSYSLADSVGFFNRTYELGKIKENLEVNELICVVPYNNTKKYFIKIDKQHQNYITNINYFDHYMFPIKYDYKYGTANPYLMYCFESKMILNYDDLSKIWQNVMPSQSFNHEEQIITVIDTVENNEDLNRLFADDITWMIFKIKKRSKTNEFNDKHSFNWPYDNFSITEIAKLDVELFYEGIRNTGIEDEPSPIAKQNKTRSVRDVEIIDKEEYKRPPKYAKETLPGLSQEPPALVNPGYDSINWVFKG